MKTLHDRVLTKQDMVEFLEGNCSPVSTDHQAAITGTLHRVGLVYSLNLTEIVILILFEVTKGVKSILREVTKDMKSILCEMTKRN